MFMHPLLCHGIVCGFGENEALSGFEKRKVMARAKSDVYA